MHAAGAQNLYRTPMMPRPLATREGASMFTIPQTNIRSISAALRAPTRERPKFMQPLVVASKDLNALRKRKKLGALGFGRR